MFRAGGSTQPLTSAVAGKARLALVLDFVRACRMPRLLRAEYPRLVGAFPVDAAAARTSKQADKKAISAYIEASCGGVEAFNAAVSAAVLEGASAIKQKFLTESPVADLSRTGLAPADKPEVPQLWLPR